MHPTPPPPTSAGEWAAWVIAILVAAVLGLVGIVVALHRMHAKAQTERIGDMKETLAAVAPSAAALHAVAQGNAVLAERVDAHDDRLDKHDDRLDTLDERTPAHGPRRSQR